MKIILHQETQPDGWKFQLYDNFVTIGTSPDEAIKTASRIEFPPAGSRSCIATIRANIHIPGQPPIRVTREGHSVSLPSENQWVKRQVLEIQAREQARKLLGIDN